MESILNSPYFVLFAISMVFGLIGMFVSGRLKSKFAKYSAMPLSSGLSGAQVAEKMLRDHNIYDVQVQSVPGQLTDHYNPANRTVNLSPEVFQGRSVAAAAVAAHECGHAVQHAKSYAWLQMRSKLVPIVSVSSNLMRYVMMAAAFGLFAGGLGGIFIPIALALQGALMVFALVTLPVEFDASNRAMIYLDQSGIAGRRGEEYEGAKDALKWAGMTYFVAALASVAQFLYLLMLFMRRR
ncbi:MAG: zinc metallopeptidase [Chitinophagales bacterium]|nr:zinc metallopeptidase [Bacteroidota bacterium]MCB9257199.1 zinc metallopeptidase [Chitinophagales bacterium]